MLSDALSQYANLRDLGGLPAAGGSMRIRSGQLFRSAMPKAESTVLLDPLRALGLISVVDLRGPAERSSIPAFWDKVGCTDYCFDEAASHGGDLARMWLDAIAGGSSTVREVMLSQYRDFPFAHAPAYRMIFERLAVARMPLLFHCTVGKDRTGVAAALILAALGTPYEAIREDYLRTNDFDQRNVAWASGKPPGEGSNDSVRLEALAALGISDAAYLDTMFAALDDRYPSVHYYLADALGIDSRKLETIRAHLLES